MGRRIATTPLSRLLDLPYELRIAIFEHAMTLHGELRLAWYPEPGRGALTLHKRAPDLAMSTYRQIFNAINFTGACKQIRYETRGLLFTQNTIRVQIHPNRPHSERTVSVPHPMDDIPKALLPPYLRVVMHVRRFGPAMHKPGYWNSYREALSALQTIAPLRDPRFMLIWNYAVPEPSASFGCTCETQLANAWPLAQLRLHLPLVSTKETRRAAFEGIREEGMRRVEATATRDPACSEHGDALFLMGTMAFENLPLHEALDCMPDDLGIPTNEGFAAAQPEDKCAEESSCILERGERVEMQHDRSGRKVRGNVVLFGRCKRFLQKVARSRER